MTEIKVGAEASTTQTDKVYNPKDPYDTPGERAEGCFIGQTVVKILAKIGIKMEDDGFCSTYREWHILCRGFFSGFNTPLGAKFEPCPAMWEDEAQYYEGGQEVGYIAKNGLTYVPTTAIGTILVTNAPEIINFIKSIV